MLSTMLHMLCCVRNSLKRRSLELIYQHLQDSTIRRTAYYKTLYFMATCRKLFVFAEINPVDLAFDVSLLSYIKELADA
jgi:hypothetical protein